VDELWPRVRANEMLPGVLNDVVMEKIRGDESVEERGRFWERLGLLGYFGREKLL
ncbi:hypothetical protein Tco_0467483, partial [Tanacetum coccineum]